MAHPVTNETRRLIYIDGGREFPVQSFLGCEVLGNIKCCICRTIMSQPIEVCSDSHLTCLECFKGLEKREVTRCPLCKEALLAKPKQSVPMERIIGNLKVGCCNNGCKSIIQISSIKDHLNLCEEENIECPGKCADESTGELLRMPRKRSATHAKKCPKHFKCNDCTEYFPSSTDTKNLEKYKNHTSEKHGKSENTFAGFQVNLIDEFLLQREKAQKQADSQTRRAEFQLPLIDGDRSVYHFAGTDCVATSQEGVYQLLTNRRHFFVTVEVPPANVNFLFHKILLPFQRYTDEYRQEKETCNLDIRFSVVYKKINESLENDEKPLEWVVGGCPGPNSDNSDICEEKYINVTAYTGNRQQESKRTSFKYSKAQTDPYSVKASFFYLQPYEGRRYLFKIAI